MKRIIMTIVLVVLIAIITLSDITTIKKAKPTQVQDEAQAFTNVISTQAAPAMRTVKPALAEGSMPQWKKYTDPENKYSFEVPQSWQVTAKEESFDNINYSVAGVTATFYEDNRSYAFIIGSGGHGVDSDTRMETKTMNIGNKTYEVRTFYKGETPILVSAFRTDHPSTENIVMAMKVPPKNATTYVKTFNNVLSTFSEAK